MFVALRRFWYEHQRRLQESDWHQVCQEWLKLLPILVSLALLRWRWSFKNPHQFSKSITNSRNVLDRIPDCRNTSSTPQSKANQSIHQLSWQFENRTKRNQTKNTKPHPSIHAKAQAATIANQPISLDKVRNAQIQRRLLLRTINHPRKIRFQLSHLFKIKFWIQIIKHEIIEATGLQEGIKKNK